MVWDTGRIDRGSHKNSQSLNRYAYVMNNPTTLVDPGGLCPQGPTGPLNCPNGADGYGAAVTANEVDSLTQGLLNEYVEGGLVELDSWGWTLQPRRERRTRGWRRHRLVYVVAHDAHSVNRSRGR